jgi:hypothetical protein
MSVKMDFPTTLGAPRDVDAVITVNDSGALVLRATDPDTDEIVEQELRQREDGKVKANPARSRRART